MKVFHRGRLAGALSVLLAGAAVPAFAETTVRIGHVLADSHSWHIAAQGFAKDVADKTAGEVKVEIFPGGQLGAEKDVIEGLQFGSVQGGIIGAGSFQAVEQELPHQRHGHVAVRQLDQLHVAELQRVAKKGEIVR